MIKFEEALNIVLSNSIDTGNEVVPLSEATARVLSTSVYTDRDMPPFNKSAVDGYACRKEDITEELVMIENIAAGYSPQRVIGKGMCSKIMTGAKLPDGADTILMVEEVNADDGKVRLAEGMMPKNNICLKGEDLKKGELVLEKGSYIKPEQIAILAAMGVAEVTVSKRLKIGLLSTGDEIIEPDQTPDEVHIRNSNGWQLMAQIIRSGSLCNYYGIVRDNESALRDAIEKALSQNDVLILTGGVSMGDFDFVPSILQDLNMEILFDKIAVQPGKPSTFAVKRNSSDTTERQKVVFALPGNPVSCYIQFEMIIRPFILKSMGADHSTFWIEMASSQDYTRKHTERKALIPVKVGPDGRFSIVSYNGSAHIVALNNANAIAEIPIGVSTIKCGDRLRLFFLQ